MKKVVTTEQSQVLGVVIKELGRIVPAGILFECTDARFDVLAGRNGYHAIFVREAGKTEEPKVEAKETPKVEVLIEDEPALEVVEHPENGLIEEAEEEIVSETVEENTKKKKKK